MKLILMSQHMLKQMNLPHTEEKREDKGENVGGEREEHDEEVHLGVCQIPAEGLEVLW